MTLQEQVEELQKMTLADTKKFYQGFAGASNSELSVVGDFDAAAIRNLATELFGSWKSPAPYERRTVPYQKIPRQAGASRRRTSRTPCSPRASG